MKKIYQVHIENEFYCVAENEIEAKNLADDVRKDFFDWKVWSEEVENTSHIPKDWLNGLTYGVDEDITLKDWIAAQEKEEADKKKQEELDALQMKLPI